MPGNTKQRKITEAQKNVITTAFYRYDSDHKGFLCKEDIKVAVVSLFGYKPSKYEVNQMLGGASEIGQLNLEEFTAIMAQKMTAQDEDDVIRQTFLMFDSQCQGFLTIEDLKKAISQVAPHIPLHTLESSFREVDRDGDGRVSYKDFEFMMKYNTEDGF